MRISVLAPISAAVLGLALAPAAEARTVTVTSAAKPVSLKVGDKLVVKLDENGTTGYSWATVSKPAFLKRLSSKLVSDPVKPGVVGAGGTRVITYRAQARDKGTLSLVYRQSFAPKADPKPFKLRVTVK